MKRARYGNKVDVVLPKLLLRRLDEALGGDGRTRSEFIRTAIIEALQKIATPSTPPSRTASRQ
jgi:metal-responsive CopG/Arc/MetJ family transcriptional regulator